MVQRWGMQPEDTISALGSISALPGLCSTETENAGRPVSRVLYPAPYQNGAGMVTIYLAPHRVEPMRPGTGGPVSGQRCRWGQAANPGTGRTPMVPLFGLAPSGVWPPARRRARPDALTARFHPCRGPKAYGGMFLCHFPSPALHSCAGAWALPSTLSGGARTFLHEAIQASRRPPGQPGFLLL